MTKKDEKKSHPKRKEIGKNIQKMPLFTEKERKSIKSNANPKKMLSSQKLRIQPWKHFPGSGYTRLEDIEPSARRYSMDDSIPTRSRSQRLFPLWESTGSSVSGRIPFCNGRSW
jgi:hypothetical protein